MELISSEKRVKNANDRRSPSRRPPPRRRCFVHANQLLEDAGAAEVGGDHQNHHYEVDLNWVESMLACESTMRAREAS